MTNSIMETLDKNAPFFNRLKRYDPEKEKNNPDKLSVWDSPILPDELNAPEIPAKSLPGWLGDFCGAVSKSILVPEGPPVLQCLATLATCLQKKFIVHCKDDHYETLSLWTFSALDSGARKSAIVNVFKVPIASWEKDKKKSMGGDIAKTETTRKVELKNIDRLEAEAGKEADEIERLELITGISELREKIPEEKIPPCLWTGDVTPETLQDMLAKHDEKMALLADEGGIFQIMGGLYSAGRANIDVFMQAYTGSPVRIHRQTRIVEIDNPALTFGLIVQPSILEDFCQGGKTRFKDIGVMGRFLYCIPTSIIGHRILLKAIAIPPEIKTTYNNEIKRLLDIEIFPDDEGTKHPKVFTLSKEALTEWEKFAQYIENNQGEGSQFWEIQTWTAKIAGNALRIAGLLHVAMGNDEKMPINKEIMDMSLDLCQLLIPHAQIAYNKTASIQFIEDAKMIYKWILTLKKAFFTQRECHKKFHGRFKTLDRMLSALRFLTTLSTISEPTNKETGGRPSIIYGINPAVIKTRKGNEKSKNKPS